MSFLLRVVLLVLAVSFAASRVIELDNNFGTQRYQSKWLVMFYAPWCHHCRALESTWTQVGNDFHDSDLNVGRLDCTKHQKVASEFHVRGYPTVLYIYGDHIVEYEGDRTKHDIIEFARKTNGPVVRPLADRNELQNAIKNQDVFFLYVADDPDIDAAPDADQQKQRQTSNRDVLDKIEAIGSASTMMTLLDVVEKQAKEMRKYLYFYSTIRSQVPDLFAAHADKYPALFVYKHGGLVRQFRSVNASDAAGWLLTEQFPIMPKLSGSLLRRVYEAGRKIAVAVLDESQVEGKVNKISGHVKNKLLTLAKQRYSSNENDLLFAWANGNELVNTLTYTHHTTPTLVVLDPTNETYYVPELKTGSSVAEMSPGDVEEFLYNVTFNKARAHGGKGIHKKVYRIVYQLASFIYRVFSTQPIFACVLFGLPLGVLAVICVVMWSADFSDNNNERRPNRRARAAAIDAVGGHHNIGNDDDEDLDDDDDDDYDDGEVVNANVHDMDDASGSEVEEVDDDALMQVAVEQQQGAQAGGGVLNQGFDAGVEQPRTMNAA